jgi:hypothetical protein
MTSKEIAARLRAAIDNPTSLLYAEDAEYVLKMAATMVEGFQTFLDKTDWVQMEYTKGKAFPGAAGKHRADLMTAEIERLRAENAQLRGAAPVPTPLAFTDYLTRDTRGFVELRQTRYRAQYEAGNEHPHDVCAVARSKNEMRQMTLGWKGSIDWDSIPEDE